MPVANFASSARRASVTSSALDVRNTRGIVGRSTATRRIASSSNDWMITGVVFSDSGFSRPFFLTTSTKIFSMSRPRDLYNGGDLSSG